MKSEQNNYNTFAAPKISVMKQQKQRELLSAQWRVVYMYSNSRLGMSSVQQQSGDVF